MSLTVSPDLLVNTTNESLQSYRDQKRHFNDDREIVILTSNLDKDALQDLIAAAEVVRDTKTARAVNSILLARAGKFDKPLPNFKAFRDVLEAFLKSAVIDGWIYVTADDGKLYPELVTSVIFSEGDDYGRKKGPPNVTMHTIAYGLHHDGNYKEAFGVHRLSHSFAPHSVANRRVADILAADGIYKETPALRDAHIASLERHYETTQNAFAKQFRVTGAVNKFADEHYRRRGMELANRRVIHDLESKDLGPVQRHAETTIYDDSAAPEALWVIPEHPLVKVFDLNTHEFFWVHSDFMTPYAYDKSLRDKLILPATHRDLLDVLTSDLGAFANDFIEGKSAGNVILCKGVPGVGKTLTAEVYAELIERPLYSVHSGSLGTTAAAIEGNLRTIFQRGKRWDCTLLLDEADVYVVQRGNDIEQNAIVAEFLRTFEYFDGLLFLTTNRPDDIDDAIISRCAAIIDYAPPGPNDAAAIWRVMATQFKAPLSDDLISQLVAGFPKIAPRDIKMLLRLALRVSNAHGEPLSQELFRRCAMFRAIKMAE